MTKQPPPRMSKAGRRLAKAWKREAWEEGQTIGEVLDSLKDEEKEIAVEEFRRATGHDPRKFA